MIIGAVYSFNNGEEYIQERWPNAVGEIEEVVASVDSSRHKTKESKEVTMTGRMLFSPVKLNKTIKREFLRRGWQPKRVKCDYPTEYYRPGYTPKPIKGGPFREMDFIKDKLGIEVQFGKYSFMVYNVCAKMTIFHNLGYIDAGIEIVPLKSFADHMSSGVSYFEQFVWDLEKRGVSDIDLPCLILGIAATQDADADAPNALSTP